MAVDFEHFQLMKKSILVFVVSLTVGVGTASLQRKPALSRTPLNTEELELYGIFLDSFVGNAKEPVTFSEKTFIIEFGDSDYESPCLNGIRLKNSTPAVGSIHLFPAIIADGRAIRLVDPSKHKLKDPGKAIKKGQSVGDAVIAGFQAAMLSVSEIAFDEAHHFAIFRYSFVCGFLCGRG